MRWVRTWLPLAIIALGIVLAVAGGGSEDALIGAAGVVGAGLAVWLLNWFFRIGVKGDLERDAEDRARDFYDVHGYWPDEAPAQSPEPRTPPHPAPPEHARARPRRPDEGRPRRPHRRGP